MIAVDTAARTLTAFGERWPCAIGRNGACDAADKREGDGMTPRGRYTLRTVLARPDRVTLTTALPWRWLRPADGWSDDPADPAYNRPVTHPHTFSAERLWRDDGLYDVIVTLSHNDAPPIPRRGSAIFLHCWNDAKPTEGCVAVERDVLAALATRCRPGAEIGIG